MKIVHCLIHYFPYQMAGTEVYTQALATLQKKEGFEVSVVTPYINWWSPGNSKEHYQYEGVDVYQFNEPGNPSDPDLYTGKKKPEGVEQFIQLLQTLRPDIIHFHQLNISNGLCMWHVKAAKATGARVFFTMHLSALTCYTNVLIRNNKLCDGRLRLGACTACSYNSLFHIPYIAAKPLSVLSNMAAYTGIPGLLKNGRLKTFLSVPQILKRKKNDIAAAVEYFDKLVCLTDWYREMLLANNVPADKIAVIKQALAHNPGTASRSLHKPSARGTVPVKLVFVGRIQPQKGVLMMIKAVSRFTKAQLTLDIFGKEEKNVAYFQQCMELIQQSANITWGGALNGSEVVNVLATYDMLCLPSTFSEMSPLVIQEAFAAGIPVLASKVHGNLEQVKHGHNGLLFDFCSEESLLSQLNYIIANREVLQQLTQNVSCPSYFEDVHKQYLQLYAGETLQSEQQLELHNNL